MTQYVSNAIVSQVSNTLKDFKLIHVNISKSVFFYPVAMSLNYSEECSSSSANMYTILENCMKTTGGIINLSLVIATNVFIVLPLAALVLYVSVRRWLQSSRFTVSHSDHFTYHMIVNEVLNFAGLLLLCYGVNVDLTLMVCVGLFFFSSNLFGHMFFDTLTCVERYLAVVHPVTYRNLKNVKGVRIRNVAIGCCWLLSFSVAGFLFITDAYNMSVVVLFVTVSSLIVVSFCSLCVLCILIRPGPRKVGEVKKQVDQSKLRAFYTILIILAVMLIRLIVTLSIDFLYTILKLQNSKVCDLIQPIFWTSFPTSVMPFVLFLQREGKICCRNNKV